ncbi:hypothetical protein F4809DRAFT_599318 [Biscogniauxia mediterranea]|nr:hypothetical protein F4809DRAFT_599318 [Biscogniauxia mediterranea]
MAPRYDEAPQVAEHTYPEVHYPPTAPEIASYHQSSPSSPYKSIDDSTTTQGGYSTPGAGVMVPPGYGYDHQSPAYGGSTNPERGRTSKRICGCSLLVFILSFIIAVLSAAVIGLAAGTGVEASRANAAEAKLAALNAAATSSSSTPSSTPDFSSIDRNCSTDSSGVTGTNYTTYFFGRATFRIYCNSDTPNAPLQSFWVANFDDCMDACASYSWYIPSDFSNNSTSGNATCAGLSFIPAWTNRTFADLGSAPGNCYLKPGPQNSTGLTNPNVGSAVHAAILQTDS